MLIKITKKARKELSGLPRPLHIELELYFSCLIRKKVLFHDEPLADGISIPSGEPNLNIQFRPVMTKSCLIGDLGKNDPAVERFPIVRGERYFPKWFKLDFRKGNWEGEFGYGGQS